METFMKHSREEARRAKQDLLALLSADNPRISVGIGMNSEQSDYALTVSVEAPQAASALPDRFQGLDVMVISDRPFVAL